MDFLPKVTVNRLSPPSEAGAKETGSLIIVRWHPQLEVMRKGLEDIFWLMLESTLQLVGVP